jgi:glycosyltransferase involved in cell wall biosynthesis
LSAHFPPDLSGDGDYTYFLANALAGIGCDVQVITAVGEMDAVLYPLARDVRIHRVVKTWGVRGLPDLVRAVRSLDTDVLVVQYAPHAFHPRGVTLAISLLPALVRLVTRLRVMVNFHELYIPFGRSLRRCLGSLWQRAMGLLIAAPSHVLTAVSSEWPRRLRRVGVWKRIDVIPVGSNIPRAQVRAEELKAVRAMLGVDPNTLLIGAFGSAGPDRDIGLLFAALSKLREVESLKLVWLGKSGFHADVPTGRDYAARFIEDDKDIIWTGPLPHPEVSRMMSACDLFVLPLTDGISTKRGTLAAALQHGLPILTTRGKRLDDLFVQRENIYLVPQGDFRAFAEGLTELARGSDLRDRLALGARRLYEDHFSWEVIAARVAALCDRRQS